MNIIKVKMETETFIGIGMQDVNGDLGIVSEISVQKQKMPLEKNPVLFGEPKLIMQYKRFEHMLSDEYLNVTVLDKLDQEEMLVVYSFMGGSQFLFSRIWAKTESGFADSYLQFALKNELGIPEMIILRDCIANGHMQEIAAGIEMNIGDRSFAFYDETHVADLVRILRIGGEKMLMMEREKQEVILWRIDDKLKMKSTKK